MRRDLCGVAAFAILLAPPTVVGWTPAPWLLGAAIATLTGLALVAIVLAAARHDLAAKLIVEGHGRLPVTAIHDECKRLMEPEHRRMLARSLESIADAAREHPAWLRSGTLPCSPRALREAEPHLTAVCQLLLLDRPGLRGVALAQRLLVDGGSPLRGNDPQRLCEELRRISVLLQERDADARYLPPDRRLPDANDRD